MSREATLCACMRVDHIAASSQMTIGPSRRPWDSSSSLAKCSSR